MSGWNIDDDIMEDFSFTPAPETKAAKAPEPAAIATTHKVDYDGDIEMMDIEAPEDIQDVNDSILIARIKAKREPKKAVSKRLYSLGDTTDNALGYRTCCRRAYH